MKEACFRNHLLVWVKMSKRSLLRLSWCGRNWRQLQNVVGENGSRSWGRCLIPSWQIWAEGLNQIMPKSRKGSLFWNSLMQIHSGRWLDSRIPTHYFLPKFTATSTPKLSDPNYEKKMKTVNLIESRWNWVNPPYQVSVLLRGYMMIDQKCLSIPIKLIIVTFVQKLRRCMPCHLADNK